MAKAESRITKVIKFNLNERGWKFNGKDRSNYDVASMVAKFNSPEIQEQVKNGKLNGFCGHQIRQRYGMIPPEVGGLENGEIVLLEPGIRTVYLKAYENGDVEHRQEFYQNPTGDHILRQYKAKQGGFSTAMNYMIDGSMLKANVFGGFDYVFSQNFLDNACVNEFDSLMGTESMPVIQQMLESQIVAMYDSINETNQAYDYLQAQSERTRQLEVELRRIKSRDARRVQKEKQLSEDHFDSLICSETNNFAAVCDEANSFLGYQAPAVEDKQADKKAKEAERYVNAITKIGGWG